jgi:hypothetical protein
MNWRLAAPGAMLMMAACTGYFDDPDGNADRAQSDGRESDVSDATPPSEGIPLSGLRRLTVQEYDNTIRDLLGDDSRPSRARLPPDSRKPFDNDWTTQLVSPALIDGVELLATEVSSRLLADMARRDRIVGCSPTGPADATCFRSFITTFGRRALRHALSEEEITRYMKAQTNAIDEGDFYAGVDVVVRAMLQDPSFLYRIEIGIPVAGRPDLFRLTDFEIATRLSYFLWGSMPDDRLLDRAAAGKLHGVDDVRAAATDLLTDPRARDTIVRFHSMWLGYEQIPTVTSAMHDETSALLTRVIFDERKPWPELFRATETYVPSDLATHYGLKADGSGSTAPRWTSYAGTERRGILSHGSFLALGARADDTSPTLRGKAVRTRLLCQVVMPPPPGVKIDQPPPKTAQAPCKTDRYREHSANPACKGCHVQIDPIGFGLENYDARGRYRTKEDVAENCPIDGKGEVAGVAPFHGPGELGDALLQGGMGACLVKQLYRFANGRTVLDETDERLAAALAKTQPSEFRLDQLLLEIVSSPSFGYRREAP